MRNFTAVVTTAVLLTLSVSALGDESQDNRQREPAAAESAVMSPDYLDQVNAEKQAQDLEEQQARIRHQRVYDAFTRPR